MSTNQATIVTSECVPACVDSDSAHHYLSTIHQCVEKLKYTEVEVRSLSIPQVSGTTLSFAAADSSNIYTSSGEGTIVLPNFGEGTMLTVTADSGSSASYKIKVGDLDVTSTYSGLISGTVHGIISKLPDGNGGLKMAFVPIL